MWKKLLQLIGLAKKIEASLPEDLKKAVEAEVKTVARKTVASAEETAKKTVKKVLADADKAVKKAPAKKKAPATPEIGRETRLELYRLQLELRYCEKRAYDLFLQNMIKGTSHLSLGQEAIAAAFGVEIGRAHV